MKRSSSSSGAAAPALRLAADADREHTNPTPTTNPTAPPTPTKPDDATLITDLFTSRGSLKSIAERHGISLIDLASRIASPGTAAALHELCRLSDAHTALIVSRGRGNAGRALVAMARDPKGKETARKACLDLLGLRSPSIEVMLAQRGEGEFGEPGAPTEEEAASVRALMQRLAERTAALDEMEDAAAREAAAAQQRLQELEGTREQGKEEARAEGGAA